MKCKFCFAPFLDVVEEMDLPKEGRLPEEDSLALIEQLAEFGFEKINFAGGEPTLLRSLPTLIARAKALGMVTSIVTNGSRITERWLDSLNGTLDWIAVSIDTVDREKLIRMGRAIGGKTPITEQEYLDTAAAIKQRGIRLKINTVVNSVNWEEDLTGFICAAKPERWKLLQALPVKGQNDAHIEDFVVTPEQFKAYVHRNRSVEADGIQVVPENNAAMTESYAMIDPAGRFYDNAQGSHTYSQPALKTGVEIALTQVAIDPERFRQRGGIYEWNGNPHKNNSQKGGEKMTKAKRGSSSKAGTQRTTRNGNAGLPSKNLGKASGKGRDNAAPKKSGK